MQSVLRRGLNPLGGTAATRDGLPVLGGGFPIIGHLAGTAIDALGLLRKGERELGPLFYWNQGFGQWLLVYMGSDAFTLFKTRTADSGFMREGRLSELFGSSLIAHDDAFHTHLRTAMNGPFLPKGLAAAEVGPLVAGIVGKRVAGWVGRRGVRVLAETRELALDVMFRLVGVEPGELAEWRRHYERVMLLAINLPVQFPGTPYWFGMRARRWLDGRLGQIVTRARETEGHGLLHALVRSRDENGRALTDGELIDNLRLLFLAGHETSASTMAWMVAHLAERPEVWARLRDEAMAGDPPSSPRDLKRFPYAEAVFRESLRLHPPVHDDARRATADFDLHGHRVRKGTLLTIPILTLSRDPSVYADPDAFHPERWLDKTERTPLELVQFGGGPHFCLGYHLAWMEIVQFAVALARALPNSAPRLEGPFPAPRYFPLLHPAPNTRIRFD